MHKIALLFPGQGSHFVGMGKKLFEESSIARQTFEEANDVLGFDIKKLCFEGSMQELTETQNTQPAIFTVSMAAFRTYMREYDAEPSILAGHSLGEISALAASNAIRFEDGLRIVRQRGIFMKESCTESAGSMAAISGISRKVTEEICNTLSNGNDVVVLANINSPDQVVISGHKLIVEKACDTLTGLGARTMPLNVAAAFHSPLMKPAAERLRAELRQYKYSSLKWPVLSNVTAEPYVSQGEIIDKLTCQIESPVRWEDSMQYLQNSNIDFAVEMEPKTVLKKLMGKNIPGLMVYASDDVEDMQGLKRLLQGSNPDKENQGSNSLTVIERCLAIAVCTRNRNWNNEEYRKGVVEPYKQVKQMQEVIESENRMPAEEEIREALRMLTSVFNTKQVPIEEQTERFNMLSKDRSANKIITEFLLQNKG